MKIIATFALILLSTAASAQEISVPKQPDRQHLIKSALKYNERTDIKGYGFIQAAVIAPLGDENYAFMPGILIGKRKGDSFHYIENLDFGFICYGTGQPNSNGGTVSNECFLNGQSTGADTIQVPNFGKVSGKITFEVKDQGDKIGIGAMQWGLTKPKPKALMKYLKANGG